MKKLGICFHPRSEAARKLAEELCDLARAAAVPEVWLSAAWHDLPHEQVRGTDLLLCVGGDGTVLWGARRVLGELTLLLGINMGRIGFLTELTEAEAKEQLPAILEGRAHVRVEQRAVLQAETMTVGPVAISAGGPYHAVNDVVVSRGSAGRPVWISVAIDGAKLAVYRCDAVIVATATGSTGYSLSAGGPILHPESRDVVITPVAAHFSQHASLVLPPSMDISLTVSTDHTAVLSVDGQGDFSLSDGATVHVRQSPYVTQFLRLSPPLDFYSNLSRHLAWLRPEGPLLHNGRD